jgi:hypothetical protein
MPRRSPHIGKAIEAFQVQRLALESWSEHLRHAGASGQLQALLEAAHHDLPSNDYESFYQHAVRDACHGHVAGTESHGSVVVFGIPVYGHRADIETLYRRMPLDAWLRASGQVAKESQIRWVTSLSCESAMSLSLDALAALRDMGQAGIRLTASAMEQRIQAWRQSHLTPPDTSSLSSSSPEQAGMHLIVGWRVACVNNPDVLVGTPSMEDQARWQNFLLQKFEMMDLDLFRRMRVHSPAWWEEALQMTTRLHLGCEITKLQERFLRSQERGVRPSVPQLDLTVRRRSMKSDARVLVAALGTDLRSSTWIMPATYADAHGGASCVARMWQELRLENQRLSDARLGAPLMMRSAPDDRAPTVGVRS